MKIKSLIASVFVFTPFIFAQIAGVANLAGRIATDSQAPFYNTCLIHGWPMTEGSGLTLHDIIEHDDMTVSAGGAITWQSNTGMPGSTPYFNGSGYAVDGGSTDIRFDGTAPFSVVVWTVGSGSSGSSVQQWIVGNETFSSPYLGWGIFQNSNNGLAIDQNTGVFDLIDSLPSDALQVTPGFQQISSATLHYFAVSYDGSKKAAGVTVVNDGTTFTSTIGNLFATYDTLAGSTVSINALQVGEAPGGGIPFTGAISNLAIYNCALSTSQMINYEGLGPGIN
jgi:hypothetical protein